jgi:hypothetical protein
MPGTYLDELAHVHAKKAAGVVDAADAAAARARAESRAWRRRCKVDP